MVIRVDIPGQAYDIVIARGALKEASRHFDLDRKVLVVSDEGVPSPYVEEVLSQCPMGKKLILRQGDANKNLSQVEAVYSSLSENGFSRGDAVIALGGGMIGDLAGFAASTYMRGIDFYNIPTTLLSQVDSSIGGKTGVNFNGIKNIVGAFYQPKKVLIDPDTLSSLSPRLFAEGLVEAIKMAATNDASLFEKIEHSADIHADIEDIIVGALKIKKSVVEIDPKEKGPRMVLNFGHTVGHAIEALGKGEYFHGEAVGIGMLYASSGEAKKRIRNLLLRHDLPTQDEFDVESLMEVLSHDKKKGKGGVTLCLVEEIGQAKLVPASFEEIRARIARRKSDEE